jgi:DHA1 family bicyclomycin/chloramphenicol resistance-like MFS transporter
MAMLIATVAFSTDAMLPALPELARTFSPDAPNRAQLIVTSFILGMAVGTLFVGPISDAFGRRPVIMVGAGLYILTSVLAAFAPSLELLLAARILQGMSASTARIVTVAVIRDLYAGRQMAQLMSLVMMIFALVPALAPALGAVVIELAGWRGVFLSFVIFSIISTAWYMLRQAETLAVEHRIPFRLARLKHAIGEVSRSKPTGPVLITLCCVFGILFTMISTIQPIFDITFGRADAFPLYFAFIALAAALASVLNARIVMRYGMLRISAWAILAQLPTSVILYIAGLALGWDAPVMFALFVLWCVGVLVMMSLTLGNLNALAMVPLGHVAGTAASVLGAVSTMGGVVLAVPVGQLFNGTPGPIILCLTVMAGVGYLGTLYLEEPATPKTASPTAESSS